MTPDSRCVARTRLTASSSASSATAHPLGPPDRLRERRGRRLSGRPSGASRRRGGALQGRRRARVEVLIGPADNAVVFDWEPTMAAGAELLGAGQRSAAGRAGAAPDRASGATSSTPARTVSARPARTWPPSDAPRVWTPPRPRRGDRRRSPTTNPARTNGRLRTRAGTSRQHRRRVPPGRQGRLQLADRCPRATRRGRADALVDALAAHRPRARGHAGLLRCDRGRHGAAGPAAATERPADPAGGGERRAGGAARGVHRGVRGARPGRRPGAADRRRRDPAGPLPERPAHSGTAARHGRRAGRQRERHRRHPRDPVR